MYRILLLSILMGMSCSALSQILTIRDSDTSKPIEMVALICNEPKASLITNALGQVDITSLVAAKKIYIQSFGFKTVEKSYADISSLNFILMLTPTSTHFNEVVIAATRSKQLSRNIPSRVSSISASDVALNNPQTAADLLASSGEVFIQKSQQGGGSPMIRGFSTNRLLYTVDGVRMNTAIFRAGNIQNVISIDPLAVESTEVFFGPGSVIYGSDAIGGVMSFQTISPKLSSSEKLLVTGSAVSRYSSANRELTNHFHLGLGGKKFASVTSFTYTKYDDLRMGKFGPDEYLKHFYVQRLDSIDRVFTNPDPMVQNPTGYSQMNLMQKLRYSPNAKWEVLYGFHYSETSSYSRYDRLIETDDDGLPVSAIWNYGPQIWMMNNLSLSHHHRNKVYDNMTLRIAHQYFEESRIDRRLNHHRLRTNLEEVRAYSANLDFEKVLSKHALYYGVEYVLNDVHSIGSAVDIRDDSEILVPDRYPASLWSSYAGYVSYQFYASDKLSLQAGARFSGFDLQSDFTRHLEFYPFDFTSASIQNSATTGSLGFIYQPTDSWKISVNGSSGFRAPNVDDVGKIFDFADGEVVVPNTNLSAEYAYNGELSISKEYKDVVKLDVTGFYTYLDNAMVRRAYQVNNQDSILFDDVMSKVYAIQNAAYATVYGFNMGIEIKLPSGFGLSSRYNYQMGEEEMDNGELSRSRHAAPAFGVTRFIYEKEKLSMQFYIMYSAGVSYENLNEEERQKPVIYAIDNNGNPYSPDWYTLNFKAMYHVNPNISVSAGIENITDQRYRPYSSGLVAPGRNAVFSLRANF